MTVLLSVVVLAVTGVVCLTRISTDLCPTLWPVFVNLPVFLLIIHVVLIGTMLGSFPFPGVEFPK